MIVLHFCCAICYKLIVVRGPNLEECGLMLCAFCEASAVAGKIPIEPLPVKPGWECPAPRVSEIS